MRLLIFFAVASKRNAMVWQARFFKLLPTAFMLTMLIVGALLAPSAAQARAASPSTQKLQISSLTMIDQTHGWALNKNLNHVYVTSQGPEHWIDVTPSFLIKNLSSYITSSFFLNSTDGYIGLWLGESTYLLRTYDGGHSWQSTLFTIPILGDIPAIVQINFIDPQHGWLSFDRNQVQPGEFQILLMRTTNGGKSWQTMIDTSQTPAGLPAPYSLTFQFAFTNPQDGWVTGAYLYGTVYLYYTHDGGKTWNQSDIPPVKGYQDIDFTDGFGPFWHNSHVGVLTVRYDLNDGTSHVATYQTYDGGKSWILGPSSPIGVNTVYSFPDAQDIWGFEFGSQNHYLILHSRTGGLSWQSFQPTGLIAANADTQVLVSIQFLNAATGWVIVKDEQGNFDLFQTNTGGHSWHLVHPVISNPSNEM